MIYKTYLQLNKYRNIYSLLLCIFNLLDLWKNLDFYLFKIYSIGD